MDARLKTSEGKMGECLAATFLEQKGISILSRNWRTGRLEIDLIARDGETVVFVEVKLRNGRFADDPALAVTRGKIKYLIDAASRWLEFNNWMGEIRFDIIAIRKPGEAYSIDHIIDAFGPGPEGFY